jgi:hypothetical protein
MNVKSKMVLLFWLASCKRKQWVVPAQYAMYRPTTGENGSSFFFRDFGTKIFLLISNF